MQIESRERRAFWQMLVFGLVADAALAYAVARFTAASAYEDVSGSAALLFFVLQAAAIALVIKDAVWRWAWFTFKGRSLGEKNVAAMLEANEYPLPDPREGSAESYLSRIVDDGEQPTEVRLRAAADLGAYKATCARGLTIAVQTATVFENGLEHYRKSKVTGW